MSEAQRASSEYFGEADDGLSEDQRQHVIEVMSTLMVRPDRRPQLLRLFSPVDRVVIHSLLRVLDALLDGIRTPAQAREFAEMNSDLMDLKRQASYGAGGASR